MDPILQTNAGDSYLGSSVWTDATGAERLIIRLSPETSHSAFNLQNLLSGLLFIVQGDDNGPSCGYVYLPGTVYCVSM